MNFANISSLENYLTCFSWYTENIEGSINKENKTCSNISWACRILELVRVPVFLLVTCEGIEILGLEIELKEGSEVDTIAGDNCWSKGYKGWWNILFWSQFIISTHFASALLLCILSVY